MPVNFRKTDYSSQGLLVLFSKYFVHKYIKFVDKKTCIGKAVVLRIFINCEVTSNHQSIFSKLILQVGHHNFCIQKLFRRVTQIKASHNILTWYQNFMSKLFKIDFQQQQQKYEFIIKSPPKFIFLFFIVLAAIQNTNPIKIIHKLFRHD